ncbi:MAG: exodeoxyribonuclease VII small subunit [Desulfobacterales bacterium]|jgi:exodeoxyribonuclease VII small subunit|nr:exodeoxyribonuclease VII small subunit [Desulfobacterales bacterium]
MTPKTFESALSQLEKIVQELESPELPLEKALKVFEQGVQLSKFCSKKLDETESRVRLLMQDIDGNLEERPFLNSEES